MINKKKSLKVSVFYNYEKDVELISSSFDYVNQYINFELFYISPSTSIEEMENYAIESDFAFVFHSEKNENIFSWSLYSKIHKINKRFKLIFFKKKYEENDFILFKNDIDDLIYLNMSQNNIKWKIFALLRRYWDDSHNENILIHNGVIIDLINHKVIINKKEINITKKEFQILSILVKNFEIDNSFVTKRNIYFQIYNDKNDSSRVIDQLIFRLKQKIGKDFFEISKKGIRII